jgi:hypothetical protein
MTALWLDIAGFAISFRNQNLAKIQGKPALKPSFIRTAPK